MGGCMTDLDDQIKQTLQNSELSKEDKKAINNVFGKATVLKEKKKRKKPSYKNSYKKKQSYKQKYLELLEKWKKLTD
jgi:cellulose biosynthesis protein BcsQ